MKTRARLNRVAELSKARGSRSKKLIDRDPTTELYVHQTGTHERINITYHQERSDGSKLTIELEYCANPRCSHMAAAPAFANPAYPLGFILELKARVDHKVYRDRR